MRKVLIVLLFVVAGIFVSGNALAFTTYIPHITGGEPNWTDYLQVNNNTSSSANFTLTLYNNGGSQIYSNVFSVGGLSRSQIQLKALHPDAETGAITYTESGLIFRVSYNNLSGGIAEFRTIDTLGSNVGLYFSDFTSFIQWKGAAIANMGSTQAVVTLHAIGGGAILGTYTVTIAPKAKAVGVHSVWFSSLNLSQVESIIAVTGSSSLCGIAIGGDLANTRLLFTPATPVSNFSSQGGASDSLIGNYTFVYQIVNTWTDRYTLDEKSTEKTSEGTDMYIGYNADYPASVAAGGAWYPSLSKYLIATVPLYSTSFREGYSFSINVDNTLSGCHTQSNDNGNTWSDCHSLLTPSSRKTPLGSWDTSTALRSDPIDINKVFEKKIAEVQAGQVQRTQLASPVEVDLVSKINELKAMIESHR